MEEIRGIKRVGNLTLGVFTKLCEKGQIFFGYGMSKVKQTEEQTTKIIENIMPKETDSGTFFKFGHYPVIEAEEERRSR